MLEPFYDPKKTYEDNYTKGPFGVFSDGKIYRQTGKPQHVFLGHNVFLPFGIPAGPLLNGRFVTAALAKGFDLVTYKTVRSATYLCHPWPNVLAVKVKGNLTLEKAKDRVIADSHYKSPLSITNSFGVPSKDPDVWQPDLVRAVAFAKRGQVVIGSFQGTPRGNADDYVQDFSRTARLVRETGVKIMEVNLSCPNEGTSHLLCFDIERTVKVTEAIKNKIGNIPLILKIAYFPADQLEVLIKRVGKMAQAFSAINTIPAKIVDKKGKQALPGEDRLYSGVCGHAIKWAGLDMVKRLKRLREKYNLNYTIIGVGGVAEPSDYNDYIATGADAVMSATGAMWNSHLAFEIKKKLGMEVRREK